ncbi:hypothetical protein Q361_10422 [Flavobacterium croceum DSM 17960]|uniref:Uncharacterized protein n=1 Tax=Flavobacterium croceum DSM 17960 TaxID=1121886 RepID=A0A2S4NA22_9FLAO|nr:hypothetical protein [Flavobacterium croceum]POS02303.1 hypothetical protein Q361_10422 [Flavobacterium croceum DSM 17960]
MRQIKIIWDFRGADSLQIAKHHVVHLKEYVTLEKLPISIIDFEIKNEMHTIAFLVVTDVHLLKVRDELKPHRAELFVV